MSTSSYLDVALHSFPNFCEGVIGIITVTLIGLFINKSFKKKERMIYVSSAILTLAYVLAQEYNVHSIGGQNTFDVFDVIFSITGVLLGFLSIVHLQPRF